MQSGISVSMVSAREIVQRSGIGASDVPGILGISPWETAWEVWERKKGLLEKQTTEPMEIGKHLERPIAELFSRRTGRPHEWCDHRIYSERYSWMYASPDAFLLERTMGDNFDITCRTAVLECKNVGFPQTLDWQRNVHREEGVPTYVQAQVEWQMIATGLKTGYVAALFGGNQLGWYQIGHHPNWEELLIDAAEEFWRKYLVGDQEPPKGGSRRYRAYIERLHPKETVPLRRANEEEEMLLEAYRDNQRRLKELVERKAAYENELIGRIKDAAGIEWAHGRLTWRKSADTIGMRWKDFGEAQLALCGEDQKQGILEAFTGVVRRGSRTLAFRDNREPEEREDDER